MKTNFYVIALFLFATFSLQAQDYVDIVKFSSNNASLGNESDDNSSTVYNQNLQVYYPIRSKNEDLVFLTGFTFENTDLDILGGYGRENLLMTRLNLGVKYQHSEKWSGTYLVLPKIASNFEEIGAKDFQFGGLALLGYQLSDLWMMKFGLYVSSENHGSTVTPLLGIWHRSRDEKLYINAVLPIRMDVNYSLTQAFSVGADLLTSVKSYDLSANNSNLYVQEESIRAGLYAAYGFADNAFILRVRGGYDTTSYGLYGSDDKIGAQVLTTPVSGDNRNQLNPAFTSGLYIGGDIIYRFDLRKEQQ